MDEINELIKGKLDELRRDPKFPMPSLNLSILTKIGIAYGTEHLKEILNDRHLTKEAMSGGWYTFTPEWLHHFIQKLANHQDSQSILDPWANKGSYLPWNFNDDSKAYCIDIEEKIFLSRALRISESKILVGDPFDLIKKEKTKFDLVISFPPFNMRAIQPESQSKSYSTDLLIESSRLIKENGKLIFLVTPNFTFNHRIKKAIEESNLYVEALFSLPEGSHSPTTNISSYLAVLSKSKIDETFIAKLSSNQINNDVIAENFRHLQNGKKVSLGSFVRLEDFSTFHMYEKAIDVTDLGRKTGLKPTLLRTIATSKTIKDENISDSNRTIYIPKIGLSDAVENPVDFTLKAHNYIKLTLAEDVFPSYLVEYFNTPLGKLTRESRMSGNTIISISLSSLSEAPLYLPDFQDQIMLTEVNNKIENLLLEIGDQQTQLWRNPKKTKEISKLIIQYERDTSIEKWIDKLPFPLSSILWRYLATSESGRKVEYLLHFFEAFSEFMSMLLLSSFYQDKEFYKAHNEKWANHDSEYEDWIRKANFGGWNYLTSTLLKTVRSLYTEKENREHLFSVLGRPSNDFMTLLLSKNINPILEKVLAYRNNWKGHGGISNEKDNMNRIIFLEQELNNLRQLIKSAFDECRVVSPSTSKYKEGVFEFKAKELVGNKTPFNEIMIDSLIPMEENKLYLFHLGQNKPIELLPFIKFNHESKACYFYNRIETSTVRWVSFHYEQKAEFTEDLDDRFEEVLNILKGDIA